MVHWDRYTRVTADRENWNWGERRRYRRCTQLSWVSFWGFPFTQKCMIKIHVCFYTWPSFSRVARQPCSQRFACQQKCCTLKLWFMTDKGTFPLAHMDCLKCIIEPNSGNRTNITKPPSEIKLLVTTQVEYKWRPCLDPFRQPHQTGLADQAGMEST